MVAQVEVYMVVVLLIVFQEVTPHRILAVAVTVVVVAIEIELMVHHLEVMDLLGSCL